MPRILLASTSARRQEIMRLLRVPFEAVASDYEEDMTLAMEPPDLVQHLALGKAQAVAARSEDALVIGGDTIIVLNNQPFGKPHTPERAREMLALLRGQTHQVMTGHAVMETATGRTKTAVSISHVTFFPYSDEVIEAYVATGEPLDRAGAYAIQGYGALLAKEILGDYDGILGMSVVVIAGLLREFGVEVWDTIKKPPGI